MHRKEVLETREVETFSPDNYLEKEKPGFQSDGILIKY